MRERDKFEKGIVYQDKNFDPAPIKGKLGLTGKSSPNLPDLEKLRLANLLRRTGYLSSHEAESLGLKVVKRRRGKFVVFEGGVGAGKSTQIEKLKTNLPDWHFFREPGGTDFGEAVREIVQERHDYYVHPYASLFGYSASRANLVRGIIIPLLETGEDVMLDRYWYSTYSYQGGENVSKLLIWLMGVVATKGLKPDLVLHYDLAPSVGKERKGRKEGDRYDIQDTAFHEKVRKNYKELSFLYRKIWYTIDAGRSVEEVFEETTRALSRIGVKITS